MYAHRFMVSSKGHAKGQEVRTVSVILLEPVTRNLGEEPHDFRHRSQPNTSFTVKRRLQTSHITQCLDNIYNKPLCLYHASDYSCQDPLHDAPVCDCEKQCPHHGPNTVTEVDTGLQFLRLECSTTFTNT